MKLIKFESFVAVTGNVFPVSRVNAVFSVQIRQNAVEK